MYLLNIMQQIAILLSHPEITEGRSWAAPTRRDLQRGLQEYFGTDRSLRQIGRSLRDLTDQGIIERSIRPPQFGVYGYGAQATWYRVVNLNKVFEEHLSLIESSRKVLAQEKRRRKAKDEQARGGKYSL